MDNIELGIGFEPDEEIITYEHSGIPFPVKHNDYCYRYLIATNYRLIYSNKSKFDIAEVDWSKYDKIQGVEIKHIDFRDYLVIQSKGKKGKELEYLFTYFYTHEGFFGTSYRYNIDSKILLEDLKNFIRKIIKERMKKSSKSKIRRDNISNKLKHEVWRRDNFACQYCDRTINEIELEVDHILPISKGGETVISNLQTLCVDCNRRKSDK